MINYFDCMCKGNFEVPEFVSIRMFDNEFKYPVIGKYSANNMHIVIVKKGDNEIKHYVLGQCKGIMDEKKLENKKIILNILENKKLWIVSPFEKMQEILKIIKNNTNEIIESWDYLDFLRFGRIKSYKEQIFIPKNLAIFNFKEFQNKEKKDYEIIDSTFLEELFMETNYFIIFSQTRKFLKHNFKEVKYDYFLIN